MQWVKAWVLCLKNYCDSWLRFGLIISLDALRFELMIYFEICPSLMSHHVWFYPALLVRWRAHCMSNTVQLHHHHASNTLHCTVIFTASHIGSINVGISCKLCLEVSHPFWLFVCHMRVDIVQFVCVWCIFAAISVIFAQFSSIELCTLHSLTISHVFFVAPCPLLDCSCYGDCCSSEFVSESHVAACSL